MMTNIQIEKKFEFDLNFGPFKRTYDDVILFKSNHKDTIFKLLRVLTLIDFKLYSGAIVTGRTQKKNDLTYIFMICPSQKFYAINCNRDFLSVYKYYAYAIPGYIKEYDMEETSRIKSRLGWED